MLYVCRSLFIAFLCGSLLFWDISYKGIELRKIQAAEQISDSNLGATLTMAATGLIASRLWTYPKLTPDMMAAAVGGAAFVAGEISAYMQFKEQLKDFEMDLQMSDNPDQKQIESLEKLLQSYEKAKEVAGQKKGFQLAAAAAFGVAAGIATYQAVTDESTQTTCLKALAAASTKGMTACTAEWKAFCTAETCATSCAGTTYGYAACVAACVPTCTSAGVASDCAKCEAGVAGTTSEIAARITARETPNKSLFALTEITGIDTAVNTTIPSACVGAFAPATMAAAPVAACGSYVAATQLTMAGGQNIPVANNEVKSDLFFVKLIRQIIKEAHASTFSSPLSAMGITSSIAVSFVLANSLTLSNMVDLAILIPKRRAIIWAAMMATSLMASQATQAVIDKLDANIQKVKAVLARMYKLNPGSFANKTKLIAALKTSVTPKKISSVPLNNANNSTNVKYDYAKGLPCITPEENGQCTDMNRSVQKIGGIDSLPSELRDNFNSVKDFGASINGGSSISSAAIEGSQKLGAQANAINERFKQESKKVWQIINKNSKSNIDPDKEIDKMRSAMAKSTADSLAKNNLTLENASKFFGSGLLASVNKANEVNEDDSTKKKANDAKAVNLAVAAEKKDEKKKEDGLDLGLGADAEKDIVAVEGLNPVAGGEADKSIDDYDLGQNIHKDPDQNLFEIISKRYMNSGYKRLLEKKKTEAAKAVK